jgi:Cd2+/Zn2+-exporting ATPase
MNHLVTKKFHVENLDCVACANKIEEGLKKTEGVEEAVLDFANLILHLKATDIPKALATVEFIEPQVKLTPKSRTTRKQEVHDQTTIGSYRKEIGIIVAAAGIFICQLLFEDRFHALPWAWVEYAIAVTAYLLAGWNVLIGAARTIRRGLFFDENVLMVIATIGAMAIHAMSEAVGVMLFFKVGELLQDIAVSKSRRSVQGLHKRRSERGTHQKWKTRSESICVMSR